VAEAQRHISSAEFTEWFAFYTLEPWGYEVENWRSGLVAAMVANTARDPKKHRKPYQPEDFMPNMEPKRPQTWQALKQKAAMAFAALGGKRA